jgi:acetyl-CoA synthetase
MFRGYLHDDRCYAEAFAGGWYLTGDVARREGDAYYWFVARAREDHV